MSTLELYEVEVSGGEVNYCVVAATEEQARELVATEEERAEPDEKPTVEARLLARPWPETMIGTDDGRGNVPLSQLASECDKPAIVCCSEW